MDVGGGAINAKKVTPNPRRILHPILLAIANHNLKPRGINTYSEYCSFIDDCPEG